MTTAPQDPRGGANGGPQYSPANVSAMGGAGQSGRDYSGFAYGQNKTVNEQRKGAPLASTSPSQATQAGTEAPVLPPVTAITAPTEQPDVSVMDGAPIGGGRGMEALTLPSAMDSTVDMARLKAYLPALEAAAALPNSSEAYRNYVRLVRANLAGGAISE